MPAQTLDVRDIPAADRHARILDAFADLESGEALELINDHDPKPLYYEFDAEVDAFDADRYQVEKRGDDEFVAILAKV